MNYEVAIVNPRTNEEQKILVELSPQQAAEAKAAPYLDEFVVNIARKTMPDGFMPIGGRVKLVTLQ